MVSVLMLGLINLLMTEIIIQSEIFNAIVLVGILIKFQNILFKICFIEKWSKIYFETFAFLYITLRMIIRCKNNNFSKMDLNLIINVIFYFFITLMNFEIDEKFLEFMVRKCTKL